MAILAESNSSSGSGSLTGWFISDPAPAGTHVGVCLDIKETYGADVTDFETRLPVKRDIIRFLFGVKVGDEKYLIQSNDAKISGHEKSALVKLITSWMGHAPDIDGFNTEELRGRPIQLSTEKKTSALGNQYGKILSVAPVLDQFKSAAPKPEEFNELMVEAGASIGELPKQSVDPLVKDDEDQTAAKEEQDVPF